jgi:hypothetical protein
MSDGPTTAIQINFKTEAKKELEEFGWITTSGLKAD